MTRYAIREPNRGGIVAYHVREDGPDGKRMHWELPGGTVGLNGTKVADLPLFGAAAAHRWDADEPVIVTEGEKAAGAVVKAGYQAVGTVTGAAGCPSRESLMILAGMAVLLWPDADDAGRKHMRKVAGALGPGGELAASVGWIEWAGAPPGGDAADAFASGGSSLIDSLIANAGDVIAPLPNATPAWQSPRNRAARNGSGESPIATFNREIAVSDLLSREYGVEAKPGRAVRCPLHDDRSPSLSVLPDDRRAYCHSPSCALNNNGRGRDAWDLYRLAQGTAA